MHALSVMRPLLDQVPARLEKLPGKRVLEKPAPDRWSPQEELGHLLDSAANNHQRIVRAQLEEKPAMPGYNGDQWVELHRYQQRDWRSLIALWHALNEHLLSAAAAVPDSHWRRTCTIANSEPVTLAFVFEDYVRHMLHHLRHIGVEVDDLISVMPSLGTWQSWPGGRPPIQEPVQD